MTSNRGFALTIMLVALIFLSLFLVVSARMFGSVARTAHTADEVEREMAAFESAVRALRRDAWGAQAFAPTADGAAVAIESSNGSRVQWQPDDGDALVRAITGKAGEHTQRWPQLGGRLRFTVAGPTLVVSVDDARGTPEPGELRLVSQVLLAREMIR